jgi:hypothetical protein
MKIDIIFYRVIIDYTQTKNNNYSQYVNVSIEKNLWKERNKNLAHVIKTIIIQNNSLGNK